MNLPWMPLYVADYLADTRRLSTLEHGAYLLLIMEYWQHGGLPNDEQELAKVCGLNASEWRRCRPALIRMFQDGWRHKRIDAERAKAIEVSEKNRERASKAAKARYAKDAPPPTEPPNEGATGKEGACSEDASSMLQADAKHAHSHTHSHRQEREGSKNDILINIISLETRDPFRVFPRDGTIAFSPWAERARKAGRNIDVDVLASAFRKYCHAKDIPFDAPRIAATFDTFVTKHRVSGAA